jgi:hypothetical protein
VTADDAARDPETEAAAEELRAVERVEGAREHTALEAVSAVDHGDDEEVAGLGMRAVAIVGELRRREAPHARRDDRRRRRRRLVRVREHVRERLAEERVTARLIVNPEEDCAQHRLQQRARWRVELVGA